MELSASLKRFGSFINDLSSKKSNNTIVIELFDKNEIKGNKICARIWFFRSIPQPEKQSIYDRSCEGKYNQYGSRTYDD